MERVLILFILILAPAARADVGDRARARAAFREALRHYNLGEFADARAGFKDAYRAYDEPSFLFDIAQCERQLGLKQDAINSYRAYLRAAKEPPNRAEVTRLIGVLETALRDDPSRNLPPPGVLAGDAQLALQSPAIDPEPQPSPPAPSPRPPSPTPSPSSPPPQQLAPAPSPAPSVVAAVAPERHRRRRALAIGLGVGGAVLVAAGVIVLGFELGQQYPTAGLGAVTLR
jgi:tetratricopeptide (TPR) repeat protein